MSQPDSCSTAGSRGATPEASARESQADVASDYVAYIEPEVHLVASSALASNDPSMPASEGGSDEASPPDFGPNMPVRPT